MTIFVLGRDRYGTVAEDRTPTRDGKPFRYYLTECCGASAKGLGDGDYGYVGCRACYTEIDPALGGVPGVKQVLKPGGDITRYADWEWVEVPLDLVEVYGDGLPYDQWKSTVHGRVTT